MELVGGMTPGRVKYRVGCVSVGGPKGPIGRATIQTSSGAKSVRTHGFMLSQGRVSCVLMNRVSRPISVPAKLGMLSQGRVSHTFSVPR